MRPVIDVVEETADIKKKDAALQTPMMGFLYIME
jgi:hypothetical protein